jgi:hypothetical protein
MLRLPRSPWTRTQTVQWRPAERTLRAGTRVIAGEVSLDRQSQLLFMDGDPSGKQSRSLPDRYMAKQLLLP